MRNASFRNRTSVFDIRKRIPPVIVGRVPEWPNMYDIFRHFDLSNPSPVGRYVAKSKGNFPGNTPCGLFAYPVSEEQLKRGSKERK